jgi:hypothetical protein
MTGIDQLPPDDFIAIGSFVPDPTDLAAIEEALGGAGIDFRMEGSRAYQISVLPADAARAIEALKRSGPADRITIYAVDRPSAQGAEA